MNTPPDHIWLARAWAATFTTQDERENVEPYVRRDPAVLAELPEVRDQWQPIETAPKGWTEFQAWCVRTDGVSGQWWEPRARFNGETGAFEVWGRTDYDTEDWDCPTHFAATHWQAHPKPPAAIREARNG